MRFRTTARRAISYSIAARTSVTMWLIRSRASVFSPSERVCRAHGRTESRSAFVGKCRRDLLDHVIVLNERHLKRLLNEYVDYYHEDRTHLGLVKETPQDARWKPIQNHNAKLFPCHDWAVCITDTILSHSFLSSYLAQNISKFSPLNLHVLACPILKPPHCSAIKLTQGITRARPDC
jgi:hypothetical protein